VAPNDYMVANVKGHYLVNPEKVSLTLLEFLGDPILQTALLSLTGNKSSTKMRSSISVGSRLSQPSVD